MPLSANLSAVLYPASLTWSLTFNSFTNLTYLFAVPSTKVQSVVSVFLMPFTEADTSRSDDDDEFDLDNSDDLNRFINKYEQMLSSKPAGPALSKPKPDQNKRSKGNFDDIDSLVEEELSRKSE